MSEGRVARRKPIQKEIEQVKHPAVPLLPPPSHHRDRRCSLIPGRNHLRQRVRRILHVRIHQHHGIRAACAKPQRMAAAWPKLWIK